MTLPPLPPDLDPRGRRKHAESGERPHSGRHLAVVGVKVVAASLSVFLVVYIGYLWSVARGLNDHAQRLSVNVGNDYVDPATGKTTHRNDIDGQDENILIVGNDDRSNMTNKQVHELKVGHDGGSLATDTMMIVHVPADGSKATLISLPRDSYVDIPGYGMNRLNAAYAEAYTNASGDSDDKRAAGANKLLATVENLTGLNIDHFVQVSLLGFVTISDAVGGVQVNLCSSVDDTVAHNRAIGSDGGSGLVLPKGKSTIKGVQALEFVRQRHGLKNGDLDRTARQRYFLTAAFRKVASAGTLLNIGRLKNLIDAVDKSIWVDDNLNMLDLARQMSNLSANNIVGKAIPFEGFWNDSPVGSVERIDPKKVQAFVRKMIGTETTEFQDAKTVDPSTVSLTVENGGTVNGGATDTTKTLKKAGFDATVGQDVSAHSSTVIEYPSGMAGQAKTLAKYVPNASVQQSDVPKLTLIMGGDKARAQSKPSSPHKSKSHKKAIDSGCIN